MSVSGVDNSTSTGVELRAGGTEVLASEDGGDTEERDWVV